MNKILHILDHFVPISSGYSFRTQYVLESQRRVLGVKPVILTSPRHGAGPEEVTSWQGIPIYSTPRHPKEKSMPPLIREAVNMMNLARAIVKVARIERPDVIHAHSPVLNAWPALWAGRKLGLPVVYEIRAFWEDAAVLHGTTRENSLRYQVTRLFETGACRCADAVVTICEGLRKQLLGRNIDKRKIFVLPNGVDLSKFRPVVDKGLRKSLGLADHPVVGFLGTLYRYEGLSLLMEAMASMAPTHPGLRCLIAGEGFDREEEELKAQAERLGVADKVLFIGKVPHDRVTEYYGVMDILVYPRVRSRLLELVTPLKILEAQALGKPVLGSDVGGIQEIIEDGGTGRLFQADRASSLQDTLTSLLGDRMQWSRLGDNARRYVQDHRQWDTLIEGHRATYRHVGLTV